MAVPGEHAFAADHESVAKRRHGGAKGVGAGRSILLEGIVGLWIATLLPIIRNTYTAIRNVDPALRSAATGMGMSAMQRLVRVEIPIALPVILAGVRIAVVLNIGVTAIAAYIGAGGLGTFISRGISQTDIRQLITGALSLGLLAIAADYALLRLQRRLTPKGLAVRTE